MENVKIFLNGQQTFLMPWRRTENGISIDVSNLKWNDELSVTCDLPNSDKNPERNASQQKPNQGDTASSQKETLREPVIRWVKERIKQLNEADASFCKDRWDENLRGTIISQMAREESNKVTFARQELEEVLNRLEEQTPVEGEAKK